MDYAIVIVPAAPIRRKPLHQSEMINQLLFGEAVQILKSKKSSWVKLRSLHDNYEGWTTQNLLMSIDEKQSRISSEYVVTDMLGQVTINGSIQQIPFGSSLPGYIDGKGTIGDLDYSYSGNAINRIAATADGAAMMQFANSWLNVPYMWGGRSILGADCSGFVQVVCKMIGIDLARDTWQQAQEGKPIKKLTDARAGDLAFFDDKEEIVHVGILFSNEQIIHEHGKVRIDTITKKGIINKESGLRTHRLRAIKRLW